LRVDEKIEFEKPKEKEFTVESSMHGLAAQ
jgi:hypothetical protein